jgi:hypothetical protein
MLAEQLAAQAGEGDELRENLLHSQLDDQKFHIGWPGIELWFAWWGVLQ